MNEAQKLQAESSAAMAAGAEARHQEYVASRAVMWESLSPEDADAHLHTALTRIAMINAEASDD